MCNAQAHGSPSTHTMHHRTSADAKQAESGMSVCNHMSLLAGLPEQPHLVRSSCLHPIACITYMVQLNTCHTPLQSAEARSGHSMVALLLDGRQQPAAHERVERAGVVWCLSGRRIVGTTCPASHGFCFSPSLHDTSVVFTTGRAGPLNAALLARGIICVCLGGWQMDGPACLRVGSCATASQPSRLWPRGVSLVREGE